MLIGGPLAIRCCVRNWDLAAQAPTASPTPGPTAWYQHANHAGTNVTLMAIQIEALQAQVRALQGTVDGIDVTVTAIPATVTAVSRRVEGTTSTSFLDRFCARASQLRTT